MRTKMVRGLFLLKWSIREIHQAPKSTRTRNHISLDSMSVRNHETIGLHIRGIRRDMAHAIAWIAETTNPIKRLPGGLC